MKSQYFSKDGFPPKPPTFTNFGEPPIQTTPDNSPLEQQTTSTVTTIVNGDNVQCMDADGQLVKTISISSARSVIRANFNWNGIVSLMKRIHNLFSWFEEPWGTGFFFSPYEAPTNLSGNSNDDALLIPDDIIAYLIKRELQYYEDNGTALAEVNGEATDFTLINLYGIANGRIGLMNQTATTAENPISLSIDIFSATNVTGSTDQVYDEIRRVVLERNGVFSDTDRIVNVVSFRNWANSNFTTSSGNDRIRMNDYYFVLHQDGGAKTVSMFKGTTDPGHVGSEGHILSDQTLTLAPGWHQQYQAAGRTMNLLRQQNEDGNITFESDTGMNMHKANGKHKLKAYDHTSDMKNNKAQVHSNYLGSDQERKIYFYILKLQRTLIEYGQKWTNLAEPEKLVVNDILSDFEDELEGYEFYQGKTKSSYTVDADGYYDMVEGWVKNSNWSSEADSGNVSAAFSVGCQVFEKTGDFSSMMWAWQQFAYSENSETETDQDRWYYTLVDGANITVPSN